MVEVDPNTPEHRPRRLRVVALVAVVLLAATAGGYWFWFRPRSTTTATAVDSTSIPATGTFELAPDRATDLAIDPHWSIHVPEGGVASASVLTVTPVANPAGTTGGTPLATARLVLSTGQPTLPWTFTWRFDQPLSADRLLYLYDDTGDQDPDATTGAPQPDAEVPPADMHIAVLTADRMSGTAAVTHLSLKQWILDSSEAIRTALGRFFDQRADKPTCSGKAPSWLPDAVFLDDENAPMRVCVGADPADAEIAVVKVANNRGGAMLITTPVTPTWAWQSMVGDHVEDWPANLIAQATHRLAPEGVDPARTWLVPPGEQVHLGFTEAALRSTESPAVITSTFSPSAIAVGLAMRVAADALDVKTSPWGLALLVACVQKHQADLWNDNGASGIGEAFAGLVDCALEHPDKIVAVLAEATPAAVWQVKGPASKRAAAKLKKVFARYRVVAEGTFTFLDVWDTVQLPSAAFTVSLFTSVLRPANATTVVTLVGMTPAGAPAEGFTLDTRTRNTVESCSVSPAATGLDIVVCFPQAAAADVCWVKPDRVTLLCGGSPWARDVYERISTKPVESSGAAADPLPWGLELDNGLRCRLRSGGSWDGRSDGLVGAYGCGA